MYVSLCQCVNIIMNMEHDGFSGLLETRSMKL